MFSAIIETKGDIGQFDVTSLTSNHHKQESRWQGKAEKVNYPGLETFMDLMCSGR